MEKLEFGQQVVLDGQKSVVESCWAQGREYQITLKDGRKLAGSGLDTLLEGGRLTLVASKADAPKERVKAVFDQIREDEDDDKF